MMNKELMTAKILEAKVSKGMTWEAIAECVAANNPVSDEEGSGISAEGRPLGAGK